ncbi:MAG: flagellar basal body-associated FliL family protein [Ignavibacteriaceae bacterium]
MALPEESLDNIKPEDIKVTPEKSSVNLKILLIGIPIFIIQLIAVYFITANILMKKLEGQTVAVNKDTVKSVQASNTQNNPVDLGKFIYSIDDIIVNPADTDGKRLLLTSVGFDLPKVEMENEMKSREAMVKDAVISTLSSKDIVKLDDTAYRDTLKMEITGKLKKLIPGVTINNVYFSKYILQ